MLKSELEDRVAELEAELAERKDDPRLILTLEQIKKLGGRQGGIAAEALKG